MKKQDVKLIAFHLPQFHTFPENDEWWGEGFTEWVNVRKAVPLFDGHNQPRVPLNKEYYDLSEDITLKKQMDLAKEYGLYGFCFYHYWFDGKLLLEKPVEKLLYFKEKINYCFCWANEPWTRSWDGNVKDVLMPQNYGKEQDWENHLQYLMPFFEDTYYIKKDGKPVLIIYRTNNVPNCKEMIDYWNKRCIENGYRGIYVIEEMNSFQDSSFCENAEAILEFEPMNALKNNRSVVKKVMDQMKSKVFNLRTGNKLEMFSYDDVWKSILEKKHESLNKKIFLGAFIDWDNTPRKGKKGLVILGSTPEKFKQYLSLQMQRAKELDSEFVFINAWNEWGEGTYLEPDEKNRDAYLEVIKNLTK